MTRFFAHLPPHTPQLKPPVYFFLESSFGHWANNLCNCSASVHSEFTFHQNPIVSTGRWFPPKFVSFHQVSETFHRPPTNLTKSQNRRKISHLLCGVPNAHTKKEISNSVYGKVLRWVGSSGKRNYCNWCSGKWCILHCF
jgi:hypothetical protein